MAGSDKGSANPMLFSEKKIVKKYSIASEQTGHQPSKARPYRQLGFQFSNLILHFIFSHLPASALSAVVLDLRTSSPLHISQTLASV